MHTAAAGVLVLALAALFCEAQAVFLAPPPQEDVYPDLALFSDEGCSKELVRVNAGLSDTCKDISALKCHGGWQGKEFDVKRISFPLILAFTLYEGKECSGEWKGVGPASDSFCNLYREPFDFNGAKENIGMFDYAPATPWVYRASPKSSGCDTGSTVWKTDVTPDGKERCVNVSWARSKNPDFKGESMHFDAEVRFDMHGDNKCHDMDRYKVHSHVTTQCELVNDMKCGGKPVWVKVL